MNSFFFSFTMCVCVCIPSFWESRKKNWRMILKKKKFWIQISLHFQMYHLFRLLVEAHCNLNESTSGKKMIFANFFFFGSLKNVHFFFPTGSLALYIKTWCKEESDRKRNTKGMASLVVKQTTQTWKTNKSAVFKLAKIKSEWGNVGS